MVSPFEVYLVMQLDSVRAALTILPGLLAAASAVMLMTVGISRDCTFSGEKPAWPTWPKKALIASAVLLFAGSLIPSSKTAAAMILIPALTSDAVVAPVSAEARELYGLAKAALRNVAEREPKPEPKSED